MKIKKTLVVLASLGLLSGVVACDNTSESNSLVESVAHNVTTSGGKGAYVHVDKPSAKEGEAVTVTVVMTDPAYVLRSVKVGEKTLNAQVNEENPNVKTFGFQMPNENVEVNVDTYVPQKEHAVLFKGSEDVVPIGLDDSADSGDEVEFELRFTAGYTLKSIKVLKKESTTDDKTDPTPEVVDDSLEVDVMKSDIANRYYFEMPDCDVEIVVETEGAFFKLFFDTQKVIAETEYLYYGDPEVKQWKMGDFISAFMQEDGTFVTAGSSTTSAYMRAGSMGVLRGKRPTDYSVGKVVRATHYYVDGVEAVMRTDIVDSTYTPTIQYAFEFEMPNHDAEITVAFEECNKVKVELDLPSQVEGRLYHIVDSEEVDITAGEKLPYGERVYYTANLKSDVDTEQYDLDSTYISIMEYSSEYSLSERENTYWSTMVDMKSGSNSYIKSDGEYVKYFDIPKDIFHVNDKMTIKVTVKDKLLYKDKPFVGKMWGNEFYSLKPWSATNPVDFEISSDGTLTSAAQSSYLNGTILNIDNLETDYYINVKVKTYEKHLYIYNNSFAMTYNNLTSDGHDTPNDFWFFVKSDLLTSDDHGLVYQYASIKVRSTDSSDSGIVIQAFKKNSDGTAGELLGTCFADKGVSSDAHYDIIPGVTITMIEGNNVGESGAKYTVARDGVTYYTAE